MIIKIRLRTFGKKYETRKASSVNIGGNKYLPFDISTKELQDACVDHYQANDLIRYFSYLNYNEGRKHLNYEFPKDIKIIGV